MEEVAQCIEFTIEELEALQQAQNLSYVLKICFLYGSDEAFHALCSIVEYGKDLSATSKRIKRDARIDLYKRIVLYPFPHLHDPVNKSLTYSQFAAACVHFSDRWRNQFPFDELLSLSFIVDREEKGIIDLKVFTSFIDDIDKAFHSNPSFPNEAWNIYYDQRREKLFKHVMSAFESIELRNKLAYLASLACQFHLQPLASLFEILQFDTETSNEQIIGFIVQLTGSVNQGIKQLELSQAMQEISMNDPSEVLLPASSPASPFSTPNGSVEHNKISPIANSPVASSTKSAASSPKDAGSSQSNDRLIVSSGRDAGSYALDQVYATTTAHASPSTVTIAPASNTTTVEATEQSFAASLHPAPLSQDSSSLSTNPQTAQAPTNINNNIHEPSSVNTITISNISHHNSNNSKAAVPSPEQLLQTIQEFQAQAQKITETLTSRQQSSGNSDPISNSYDSVSTDVLMQQLQQMELELNKAKSLIIPAMNHRSNGAAPTQVSVGTAATGTPGSTRKLSLVSPATTTPSLRTAFSPTLPSSSSARKGLVHSPRVPTQRHGSQLDSSYCSTSSQQSYRSSSTKHKPMISSPPMSAKKVLELSLSHSKSIPTSGKLDRSCSLAHHVDLSIFKSPLSHKKNKPKNSYDERTLTWISPKHINSSNIQKRKERFQSTKDLMIAREVNPVFFSSDL